VTTGSDGSDDLGARTTAPVGEPLAPSGSAGARPRLGERSARWRRQQEAAAEDDGFAESDDEPDALLLPASQAASHDYDDRPYRRTGSTAAHPVTGQTLRAVLTIGLTFSVVVMVFLGLILRLPPADFAQYIAPLTGIAGLALGYWFGSDKNQ
jgi:hypothetical protein